MEFTRNSTGLSLGEQVDGLPAAWNKEAFGVPHGGYVSAAIHNLDRKQYKVIETASSIVQSFCLSSRMHVFADYRSSNIENW